METTLHCKNFVQNAWKKDLCSNCFKGKEDHVVTPVVRVPLKPAKEGILRNVKVNPRPRHNKVIFPADECEVIGYGGEDCYSSEEETYFEPTREAHEEDYDNEEDKEFQRITKNNTDFNSIPANLQQPKEGEIKKVVEPLKLGITRANKPPLLVTVTPFGATNDKPKGKIILNNEEKTEPVKKSSETITATIKPYQSSPTDENNPIKPIKRSQPIDKHTKYKLNKEINKNGEEKNETNLRENDKNNKEERNLTTSEKVISLMEKAKKKVSQIPETQTLKFNILASKKVNEKPQKDISLDLYMLSNVEQNEDQEVEDDDKSAKESTLYKSVSEVSVEATETKVEEVEVKEVIEETKEIPEEFVDVEERNKGSESEILTLTTTKTVRIGSPQLENVRSSFEIMMKDEEITLFSAEELNAICKMGDDVCDKVAEFTRESAGEPDGSADCDELSEPPALPLSPPPALDPRTSFLHGLTLSGTKKVLGEKPKVPAKPTVIPIKKLNLEHSPYTKHSIESAYANIEFSGTDSVRSPKRQAPKPPSPKEEHRLEDVPLGRPVPKVPSPKEDHRLEDTPPERPTSRRSKSSDNLIGLTELPLASEKTPEPMPRRSLSLSQENLVLTGVGVLDVPEKKKSNRGRFSLRKFLHLGKNKDGTRESCKQYEFIPPPCVKQRPRLEIIHPCELNGARVEVVPPVRTNKSRRCSSSASSSSGEHRESDVLSDSSQSVGSSGNDTQPVDRAKKPPPPPRNQSLDSWSKVDPSGKPCRPPPPRTNDTHHIAVTWSPPSHDNYYVNLGEARVGLAPNKPVRTASLRDAAKCETFKSTPIAQPEDSGYDSFEVTSQNTNMTHEQADENVYELVQSSNSPAIDSYSKVKRSPNTRYSHHRRSEGNVEQSPDYAKFKFLRSVSLPYCASEAESEIYSPYSFCGSELGDDEVETSPTTGRPVRMSRLKMKKGRSIVHKSLEDNYGAVIVANHEALAQVVEQVQQRPTAPPHLRPLAAVDNLRWADFTIVKESVGVVTGKQVFYPATWGTHCVTLNLTCEQGLPTWKNTFSLNPITEFSDVVPGSLLLETCGDCHDTELIQASIAVLNRLKVETLQSYSSNINSIDTTDDTKKEVNFILLQIINALKSLQAEGIEEAPMNLSNMILCREEKDPQPRLCVLRTSTDTAKGSLCQCGMTALIDVLPRTGLSDVIADLLRQEKATSLSQVKSILEFSLWGPADILFINTDKDRELALQRWLDLERASVLHGLVRTRTELTVFEESHLTFLVKTNAKMLAEASAILNSCLDSDS